MERYFEGPQLAINKLLKKVVYILIHCGHPLPKGEKIGRLVCRVDENKVRSFY